MSSLISEDTYSRHGGMSNGNTWSLFSTKARANSQIEPPNYLSNASTSPSLKNFNSWATNLFNERPDLLEERHQPYSLSMVNSNFLWENYPLSSSYGIKHSNFKHNSDRASSSVDNITDPTLSTLFLPKPSNQQTKDENTFFYKLFINDYRPNELNETSNLSAINHYGIPMKEHSNSGFKSDSHHNRLSQGYGFKVQQKPFDRNYNDQNNSIKNTQNIELVKLWTSMCENSELSRRQITSNEKEFLLEIFERLKRIYENMSNKVSRAIETVEINTLPDKDTFVELLSNFCTLSSITQEDNSTRISSFSQMYNQPIVGESSSTESMFNLSSEGSSYTHDKLANNKQHHKDLPLWSKLPIDTHNSKMRSSNETLVELELPNNLETELEANAAHILGNGQNIYDISTHEIGKCKPCAFYYNKKKGCKNGTNCGFCHHEDHSRHTLKQWKKHQKLLEEQAKLNGEHDHRSKAIKEMKSETIQITNHNNEFDFRSTPNLNQKFQSNGPAPGLEMKGQNIISKKWGSFL